MIFREATTHGTQSETGDVSGSPGWGKVSRKALKLRLMVLFEHNEKIVRVAFVKL